MTTNKGSASGRAAGSTRKTTTTLTSSPNEPVATVRALRRKARASLESTS